MKSKKTLAVLLVVIIAVALGIIWLKDSRTGSLLALVESNGGRMLGTRVDVESADIQWDAGALSLTKLEIANPGGFSERNMINVESIDAQGDLKAGVVDRLVFDGIGVLIEFRGAKSNFEVVGERAVDAADELSSGSEQEAGAGDDESADPDAGGGAEEESMFPDDWRVETVSFENISVSVQADWTSEEVTFDAGELTLENLDGLADDLTRDIVTGFMSSVLLSAAEQVDNSRLRDSLTERAKALQEKTGAEAN